jgi:sigma-B regulation protein RsbU (phosphoserine phosphatase)
MNPMAAPRIRSKFIGILIMAAVLPVTAALLVFETLGYRSYREARGRLHQARAQHVAVMLGDLVRQELEGLDDWVALSQLPQLVARASESAGAESEEEIKTVVKAIEARWPEMGKDDPFVKALLTNDIAGQLNAFRSLHIVFAEIFITDANGRLIASTDKTSDYWQADEVWWQRGFSRPLRNHYVEGIQYDESARVFSLDVAMPIRDRTKADTPLLGVLKGVIDVTPLFNQADSSMNGEVGQRQVVLEDGRVLATLYATGAQPLNERIPAAVQEQIQKSQSGWMIAAINGAEKDLLGYAPLKVSGALATGLKIVGATPMYVVVRKPASVVLAPVRQQILLLGLAGSIFLFAFIIAGYLVATRKLIGPIESLREAVHRIAGSVKLDRDDPPSPAAAAVLEPLRAIRTRDELEDLARDFAGMAQRVLGYNEKLEREIELKTSEISRDLQLAREFQEALMPHNFPKVPSETVLAPFSLNFRHLYKPASSVGGDFFDVLKLDDHRAGVFIADVMGHGARSALVTAILRTLLQNLAAESAEPARFLATLNKHFHAIIRNSGETIFVSAFYLVVDAAAGTVCYASAGHPSPFVAEKGTGEVYPLIEHLQGNPALGIFPEGTYQQWCRSLQGGELYVLFTDGVHEAYSESGEEFGLERVRETIRRHLNLVDADVPAAIVADLQHFIAPAAPADDICIVTFEVTSNAKPASSLTSERMTAT